MANSISRGAAILGLFIIIISIFVPLVTERNCSYNINGNASDIQYSPSWYGLSIYNYMQVDLQLIRMCDWGTFFSINPLSTQVSITTILFIAFMLPILFVIASLVRCENWINHIWIAGLYTIIFSIILFSIIDYYIHYYWLDIVGPAFIGSDVLRLDIGPFLILISGIIWFSPKLKDLFKWLEHRIRRV